MNTLDHMPEAMKAAWARSLMTLRSFPGCSYLVVLNGNRYEHDPAGVLSPGKKRGAPKTPGLAHGGLSMYIRKYVDNLEPGSYVEVPFVDPETKMRFDIKSLASTCASVMQRLYGANNYTTHKNDDKQCVEIFLGAKDV